MGEKGRRGRSEEEGRRGEGEENEEEGREGREGGGERDERWMKSCKLFYVEVWKLYTCKQLLNGYTSGSVGAVSAAVGGVRVRPTLHSHMLQPPPSCLTDSGPLHNSSQPHTQSPIFTN